MDSSVYILVASLVCSTYTEEVTKYITAEEITWSYDSNHTKENIQYRKTVFREFTDINFSSRIEQPEYLGLLGPVIKITVGDTLRIVFKNNGHRPLAIHTLGLIKANEDAFKSFSVPDANQQPVQPGETKGYIWNTTASDGPGPTDPDCVTSLYYSDVNMVRDVNDGLFGLVIICKNDCQEKTQLNFLFNVFYEKPNFFTSTYELSTTRESMSYRFHTINGFSYENMPPIKLCVGDDVILHLAGMGRSVDVHAVRLYGSSMIYKGRRQDSILIYPGGTTSVSLYPTEVGKWLLTSQNKEFAKNGMQTIIDVEDCSYPPPLINVSGQIRRFNLVIKPVNDTRFRQLARESAGTLFVDEHFSEDDIQNPGGKFYGTLGPLVKAVVGDMVKVTLRNEDRLPHSIHPHGFRVHKINEGMFYNDGVDVKPMKQKEFRTHYWTVPEYFGPTAYDLPCIPRYYTSGVDPQQEAIDGLIGPILICQKGLSDFDANMRTTGTDYFLFITLDKENGRILVNGLSTKAFPVMELTIKEKVKIHAMVMDNNGEGLTLTIEGNPFVQDGANKFTLTLYSGQIRSVQISPEQEGEWKIYIHNKEFITYNVTGKKDTPLAEYPEPSETLYILTSENDWNYVNNKLTDKQWNVITNGTKLGPTIKKITYNAFASEYFFWSAGENKMGTGPTIRAHVGSTIKIFLKNEGTRPISMYSPGVIIRQENGGKNLKVAPGETSIFLWTFPSSSGPGTTDHDCIARTYFSNLDKERDMNSGLVGLLIVCRDRQAVESDASTNVIGLGVVDESLSWYINETLSKVTEEDLNNNIKLSLHGSNIYAINGFAYGTINDLRVDSGGFLQFHLINIGKHFHSLQFRGATIIESTPNYLISNNVLPLFPKTSIFVRLRIPNTGEWKFEGMTYEGQINKLQGNILKRRYTGGLS